MVRDAKARTHVFPPKKSIHKLWKNKLHHGKTSGRYQRRLPRPRGHGHWLSVARQMVHAGLPAAGARPAHPGADGAPAVVRRGCEDGVASQGGAARGFQGAFATAPHDGGQPFRGPQQGLFLHGGRCAAGGLREPRGGRRGCGARGLRRASHDAGRQGCGGGGRFWAQPAAHGLRGGRQGVCRGALRGHGRGCAGGSCVSPRGACGAADSCRLGRRRGAPLRLLRRPHGRRLAEPLPRGAGAAAGVTPGSRRA